MAGTPKTAKKQPIEQVLWASADKLRKNMDAAEYKHIVLGLIFLKYISDSFYELYHRLSAGGNAGDPRVYRARNVFYVPPQARWNYLQDRSKLPTIGRDVDEAMSAIEADNPDLKGILPRKYDREDLDAQSLGGLIGLVGTIALGDSASRSGDVLGRVYEYFLGQFALAEGKKGGQFYTPRCIVQLLVEMLEPYRGIVFDPCCGSGGMFVQSEKFVEAHAGPAGTEERPLEHTVTVYGQESNLTTWRLCKMNLAMRGIDSSHVKWNNEGSFLRDAHPELQADYVIANPPFNDSDWSGELLRTDKRWQYGPETPPPESNANFAWIQHFVFHMKPTGEAGFVLAKSSLSSRTNGEDKIRAALAEAGLVDCIVNLPAKLFLNTQSPACLWFLSRAKAGDPLHPSREKILFIDARNMGTLVTRKNRTLTDGDIRAIADVYHAWKTDSGYEDVPGFCRSTPLSEVAARNYILTPARYIGLPEDGDSFDFAQQVRQLTAELEAQMAEGAALDGRIRAALARIELPEGAGADE